MNHHLPEYLTPEGRAKLDEELHHLLTVRRPEVAQMIKEAKEAGDISENAAYDEAKDQQAFVEGRIHYLEDILRRAELIDVPLSMGQVTLGSVVTVSEDGQPAEDFRITGAHEANPADGSISNVSPLGKALLGKRPGDEAILITPDGERIRFRVLGVA